MAKQLFLIVIILLLPLLLWAQLPKQKIIDSLLVLVSKTKNDSNKVNLLSRVSENYYQIDFKKGIDFGNRALHLAQKIRWQKGIEKAYNSLGSNYWAKYDIISAQDYYGRSLKVAQEIGDKLYVSINLHDIGICYDIQGNFLKAIEYYKKSIRISTEIGDKDGAMGCYSNIADMYLGQLKYNDAIKYYNQSLIISKQAKNERNNGHYYQKIGIAYSLLGNHIKALKYGENALRISQKLNDYEDIALNLNRLGNFYMLVKNYRQAIIQNQLALKILKNIKDSPTKRMETDFYASIGNDYFGWSSKNADNSGAETKAGYRKLAVKNFQKAVSIARSINYRESEIACLKTLSDVQLSQGYFAEALKTYKEYIVNRDGLNNSEKDKEYERHELSFEYTRQKDSLSYAKKLQKKEMEKVEALSASKLRQRSLYAIVAIVILLFIGSYFFFRNRIQQIRFKSRLAKEKSEIDLKQMSLENKLNDLTLASLKSQMNPHFIFNCLNSIKFYIEKNDTAAASLYITKFSKLIRSILDSARSEKITLAAEIELIGLYLEMEQMRLKEKLRYKFDIAKNIDIDFIEIPPLLIQPYIENAIWHGLMNKEEGGVIIIKISSDEKDLIIDITDNGIGREKAAALKSKNKFQHTSHGSTLNSERIAMFNAKYKTNTEVVITDLKDTANHACGTLVTIKLPIQ